MLRIVNAGVLEVLVASAELLRLRALTLSRMGEDMMAGACRVLVALPVARGRGGRGVAQLYLQYRARENVSTKKEAKKEIRNTKGEFRQRRMNDRTRRV